MIVRGVGSVSTRARSYLRSPRLKRSYSLVSLQDRQDFNNNDGFYTANTDPSDFEGWIESHQILTKKRGWGTRAYGWTWESGREIPIPWTTFGLIAYNTIKYGSKIGRISPVGLASSLLIDSGVHLAQKYWTCSQYSEEFSHLLANGLLELHELAQPGGRVRVVAHSLGCKLLYHALEEVPYEKRPHEVHFCGPAISEKNIDASNIKYLATNEIFFYYTPEDTTLQLGFPILNEGEEAIGHTGFSKVSDTVYSVNVTPFFHDQPLIHRFYPDVFHRFASLKPSSVAPHEVPAIFPHLTADKQKDEI